MIRRPPRSTQSRSSAASDVYKRQYQRRVRGLTTRSRDPSVRWPAQSPMLFPIDDPLVGDIPTTPPMEPWTDGADGLIIEPVPCLLYTSPSPRDRTRSRMPSSA
eukprot:TRINITY_DN2890_c0_g1_i1.p1 TRINITY_DN2890_c0_g1~~TRINITY_DN2890_c0_g1_i1.p1  ORF type:complete len:104 (+),score=46.46 TRINITY_DN2890_c0_g1_i1:115-426(+)